jgi:hypothetical protein
MQPCNNAGMTQLLSQVSFVSAATLARAVAVAAR